MTANNNPAAPNDATATAITTAQKYQTMFPDVTSLSSQKLLSDSCPHRTHTDTIRWSIDGENALLVDVRTQPERNVSMISGAITLEEFKRNVLPDLLDASPSQLVNRPSTLVLYCTIGYRSGMEGRKLQNEYPFLFQQQYDEEKHESFEHQNLHGRINPQMKIRNLDGILNFANALAALDVKSNNDGGSTVAEAASEIMNTEANLPYKELLINPKTNEPTRRVHTYGLSWKNCLSTQYDPVVFSRLEFAWRGLGVVLRSIPCFFYCMGASCCKTPVQH